MVSPYEATIEVLKSRLANSTAVVNQESAKDVADFAQVLFDKFTELYTADKANKKSQQVKYN